MWLMQHDEAGPYSRQLGAMYGHRESAVWLDHVAAAFGSHGASDRRCPLRRCRAPADCRRLVIHFACLLLSLTYNFTSTLLASSYLRLRIRATYQAFYSLSAPKLGIASATSSSVAKDSATSTSFFDD
jgi:hypothetical protein